MLVVLGILGGVAAVPVVMLLVVCSLERMETLLVPRVHLVRRSSGRSSGTQPGVTAR